MSNESTDNKYRIFIPYQVPSKKNGKSCMPSRATGKCVLVLNKAISNYFTKTKQLWLQGGKAFAEETKNLPRPLRVEFTFIRTTNQRFDYIGPMETVADIMVETGWIKDDSVQHIKPYFGDYIVDKTSPGVIITLL